MGLLYTELCMACEEEFGTRIELPDLSRARTVGDLYHHILKVLETDDSRRCPHPWTFFRFRNAVVRYGRCRSRDVQPDTHVTSLLPWWGRHRAWRSIQRHSELELPSLREPIILVMCLLVGIPLGLATALALAGAVETVFGETAAEFVAGVAGVGCVFGVPTLMALVLQRWAPACVPGWWTVGVLVKKAAESRYGVQSSDGRHWDSATVWKALHRVVSERLEVPPEMVTPDARLLEDLGAD